MISSSELRKGLTLEIEGQFYEVLDWQHVNGGHSEARVRVKLRNLHSGATIERTFDVHHKFRDVDLERHTVIYQYQEGDLYHFLDTTTYDDIIATPEQLGDAKNYLVRDLQLYLLLLNDEVVSVELPESVVLRVISTEPEPPGEKATSHRKPATTETGLVVQVPLFISPGDLIRVDTSTGAYIERV